jgi:dipeptidyl-peptidase-4
LDLRLWTLVYLQTVGYRLIINYCISNFGSFLTSPGLYCSFVSNDELYYVSTEADEARPIKITSAPKKGVTNGLAEFIAEEEMGRHNGYWWSPCSNFIAFCEVDEMHINEYVIMHQGEDVINEVHRYPFAGKENAKVKVGILNLLSEEKDKSLIFCSLGEYEYISRVNWLPDGTLAVQLQSRDQQHLFIKRFSCFTGECLGLLVEEHSDTWINLHDLFYSWKAEEGGCFYFILGSERSLFMHLYLYKFDGKDATLLETLTSGDWVVEDFHGIDTVYNRVFLSGSYGNALEKHLVYVPLFGKVDRSVRKITEEVGFHSLIMGNQMNYYFDTWSSLTTPFSSSVRSVYNPKHCVSCSTASISKDDMNFIKIPELISLKSSDEQETLHGLIYKPDPAKYKYPRPTIVSVYGGPHVQRVQQNWRSTVEMRAQNLCDMGYLVLKVDNRGSSRRGLKFESHIYKKMGTVEINDQIAGVQYCIKHGLSDPTRVAIYGWSYGGYLAGLSIIKYGHIFKVAIAGAPVTSWDGYDTHYTERYMMTPAENPEGYREGSLMTHVPAMLSRSSLMVIHGLIDENVHFVSFKSFSIFFDSIFDLNVSQNKM